MKRYTVKMNMQASYIAVVEGDFRNDGDALEAARNQMEDADPSEFSFGDEGACEIISVNDYGEFYLE